MVSLNNGNYLSSLNLFKEDIVVAGSNIDINYNYYSYPTSNVYATSNLYYSSNYYSTSNYDYSTSNFITSNIYPSSNYYITSNIFASSNYYITSNLYSTSNYITTSNTYYTSNYSTSNYASSNYYTGGSNITSILNIDNPYKFKAWTLSNQLISGTNYNSIHCDYVEFDPAGGYNLSNYTYTIKQTGYYSIEWCIGINSNNVRASDIYTGSLLLNSISNITIDYETSPTNNVPIYLLGAEVEYFKSGDTLQLQVKTDNPSRIINILPNRDGTRFNAHLLSVDTAVAQSNFYLSDQPIGSILDYSGSNEPPDWLICDGRAVSRSTYADLFGVIGTGYGAGNGTTTFNIPDLRNKTTIGANTSNAVGISNNSLFNSNLTITNDAFVLTTSDGYALSKSNLPSLTMNKIIKWTLTRNSFTLSNLVYDYSTSNYITSNLYYSTSNYTSNNYTSNNYGTDIRNVFNPYWGRCFADTSQSNLVSGTWTKVNLNQIAYGNALGSFNIGTGTWTCPLSGVYQFTCGAEFYNCSINDELELRLLKNGTGQEMYGTSIVVKNGIVEDVMVSDILEVNTGDTLVMQVRCIGSSTTDLLGASYAAGGEDFTHLSWVLESATGVITNSNLYLNTSATQSASNFTAFGGYSNALIATNMWCQTSNVGINTSNPTVCLDLNCTSAIKLPKGTDAQRPLAADGLFRYNTTSNVFETCSNNNWQQVGSGTGSGGTATALQTLSNVVVLSSSSPPIAGQILTATSPSNAIWSNIPNPNSILSIFNPYRTRVYANANVSLTAASYTKIIFNTRDFDYSSNFSLTSNTYIVPVNGFYQLSTCINLSGCPADLQLSGYFYVNGVLKTGKFEQAGSASGTTLGFTLSDFKQLAANDIVDVYARPASGTTSLIGGSADNYFSISLVCPLTPTIDYNPVSYNAITSVLSISNPYRVRALINAASGVLTSGVFTKVALNAESFDTNNNFTNGTYTVPITGYYYIDASVLFWTLTADRTYVIAVYKNGAAAIRNTQQNSADTSFTGANISDLLYLQAGNTIELYVQANTSGNITKVYGDTDGVYSYLSIYLQSV